MTIIERLIHPPALTRPQTRLDDGNVFEQPFLYAGKLYKRCGKVRLSFSIFAADACGKMRPARNALTLLLIIACASRISCQYDDSFDAGGSSDQNDDENESGSQEVNDADDDGGGGDEVGTGVAGRRSEDTSTTRSYGSSMAEEQNAPPKHKAIILQIVYSNDEKKNADDSIEMTTANRVQEHFGDYLPRRPFPVQGPEEPRKDVPQGGSPYIRYQGGYAPYFGRYFNQLSSRFGSSDKPHYSPPEPQMFNASSHVSSPSNGLTYAFASGQYEVNGGNGGSDSVENLSNGDRNTQEENVDYLRKLRNMAVIARLRKHYALQMSPPLIQPQQGTITRIVTAAGTHFPAEEPKTTVVLAAHKTTQALSEEMEMLRSRLRSMEIEQIKLRTILIQVKGILTEMQERSDAFRTSPAGLNMSQHEVGVARLRNLFLILRAVTQLSPLTSDEIRQINYDVGIFDPKITYDSKVRIQAFLGRHIDVEGESLASTVERFWVWGFFKFFAI
ncbi:hypothetical protein BIW11_12391 [Tropilaelaps mercedesae]|uniref:Uncharacterized protein n=1 Tax=Tropilaelaps mercedesae TaxID=418985 RepID=A0A1V9X6J9_9ACAR|nr:hypothetical protein BIW11_12391 [Tropilaelaps mercedesae]